MDHEARLEGLGVKPDLAAIEARLAALLGRSTSLLSASELADLRDLVKTVVTVQAARRAGDRLGEFLRAALRA